MARTIAEKEQVAAEIAERLATEPDRPLTPSLCTGSPTPSVAPWPPTNWPKQ